MYSVFLFGESLWQAEEILSRTFFTAGLHFFIAEDGFSSEGKTQEEVDALFERKRTESGTGARLQIVNRGKLSPRDCRYGYRLSEDCMGFTVDEETAAIVREIFRLYLGGLSFSEIARRMQERGVINPMDYKKKEIHHTVPPVPTAWVSDSVKNILKTELYTGTGTKAIRGQAILLRAEALVSITDFEKVQGKMESSKTRVADHGDNAFYRRVHFKGKVVSTQVLDGEICFIAGENRIPYSEVAAAVREAILREIADVETAMGKLAAGCEKDLEEDVRPLREKA